MKENAHAVLLTGLIFLSAIALAQPGVSSTARGRGQKNSQKTYLDLMVNVVSTNLNYGENNGALADYKKPAHGIQAGASFQAGITSYFSIVSELYFMRKGGKLSGSNTLPNIKSSLHLNTIEMPVLARFHLGKFFMNAGPFIAYSLSGKREGSAGPTKLSFSNSDGDFKRLDAGVQVGGGVQLPFKQRRIALDLRYSYGLTNLLNDNEVYTRALMVSIHYSKPWSRNPLRSKRYL
jgi:hypothetical protein